MSKDKIKEKEKALVELTFNFCSENLDEDYKNLCDQLIRKLGRKRHVPFETGKTNIWAASVIHALGSINFLFDKSFEPYIKYDDICDHFDVKKTTVTGKSKIIRDMLNLGYYDSDFSTGRMEESNPVNSMVMVDGLIVPLNSLPQETQDVVKKVRAGGKDIDFSTKQ